MSYPVAPHIKPRYLLLLALTVSFGPLLVAPAWGQTLLPLLNGTPAPELDREADWLGVEKPLQLKDLRGKFVLLDFWTYC